MNIIMEEAAGQLANTEWYNSIVRLIASEKICAIVMFICVIGILANFDNKKSSKMMCLTCITYMIALISDSCAWSNAIGTGEPSAFNYIVYFISYTAAPVIIFSYTMYCFAYVEERTSVKKWVFGLPMLLSVLTFIIIVINVFIGNVFTVVDGRLSEIHRIPIAATILQCIILAYLPCVAFAKRRVLGIKAVSILGIYNIVPMIMLIISYEKGFVVSMFSMLLIYLLVQNNKVEEKEKHRKELEELLRRNDYFGYSCKRAYSEAYMIDLENDIYEEIGDDESDVLEKGNYTKAIDSHISTGRIRRNEERLIRNFLSIENIRECLIANDKIEKRYLRTLRNGEKQWCLTTIIPCEIKDGVPTVVMMLIQNIDDVIAEEESQKELLREKNEEISKLNESLKERSDELADAMHIAQEANRAKSVFLSRMSHDIRTPMNVIVGMTEIARRHSDDSRKVTECLDKISVESVHLQTLINDVLDISEIESGKMTIKPYEVRLSDVLERINDSAKSLAMAKAVNYEFKMGNIFFPYVKCDSLKISRIYLNLLSNAVKFTPSSGNVSFEFYQSLTQEAGVVNICARISDTGIGMSEEFMEHMYSDFAREVDSRVDKIQGTGLGLAIVKQLVDLMGGKIEVTSVQNCLCNIDGDGLRQQAGSSDGDGLRQPAGSSDGDGLRQQAGSGGIGGTVFVVTIPVGIVEKTDVVNVEPDEDDEVLKLRGMRALVVEDNDMNYQVALELLSDYGVVVTRAENGRIAVDSFEANEPGAFDFILMDIEMPVMGGIEATKKLRSLDREDAKTIPIIAMTANVFSEDAHLCREAGMDSHVAKPIKIKYLIEKILWVVDR